MTCSSVWTAGFSDPIPQSTVTICSDTKKYVKLRNETREHDTWFRQSSRTLAYCATLWRWCQHSDKNIPLFPIHFYARQYDIARICYRPSSVRLSVRPSVRWVYHRKTVEVRIMKFSPCSSPIPLVFAGKFHPEILRGSPRAGESNKGGVGNTNHFLALNWISRKR